MALPWTFGVELEFAVAFVYPPDVPLPEPTETRKLRFEPSSYELQSAVEERGLPPITSTVALANRSIYSERFVEGLVSPAVQRDIAQMLQEAGLPVNCKNPGTKDAGKWQVDEDKSIEPPEDTPYSWAKIEAKSPALAFTPENLQIFKQVCTLITENYCTEVNDSTGLHVHVSAGLDQTFQLKTLQNLFAFLWVFETQMETLHPLQRQRNGFCMPLRVNSRFVNDWWNQYGQVPTLMQGMLALQKIGDMESLLAATIGYQHPMRCNPSNLLMYLKWRERNYPPTLEFRQHEGTLDPERVAQWIKTVVGIINFADSDCDHTALLCKVQEEKYQKDGSGNDFLNEQKFGPIPAESTWTIIDLFRVMGLNEQADYYSTRLHPVYGTRPETRVTVWRWEYEELRKQGKISDVDFERLHKMRLHWETSLSVSLDQPDDPNFYFDADGPMWPTHERVNKWPRVNDCKMSEHEAENIRE